MEEVFRSNNLVDLSFAEHLLTEAGVDYFVADTFISAIEGNIGAFPKRILTSEFDAIRARALLRDAMPEAFP